MADVTAQDVKSLRDATGAGMMDAKKALIEAEGDAEAAAQILREKGLAKAATRTDRENAEGSVAVVAEGNKAVLVHIKCETDFSAKSEQFQTFVDSLTANIFSNGVLKCLVIFITNFNEGSNFPVSIEFIVCLLTLRIEARSS